MVGDSNEMILKDWETAMKVASCEQSAKRGSQQVQNRRASPVCFTPAAHAST